MMIPVMAAVVVERVFPASNVRKDILAAVEVAESKLDINNGSEVAPEEVSTTSRKAPGIRVLIPTFSSK